MEGALFALVASMLLLALGKQVGAVHEHDGSNSIEAPSPLIASKEKGNTWIKRLQVQLNEQEMKQRMNEKDRNLFEKWLIDNISDLHRELKQAESDFEHYAQVTKSILEQNDLALRSFASFSPLAALYLAQPEGTHSTSQQALGIVLESSPTLIDERL